MAATVLGSIAHYGLGITRVDLRMDALAGAGFIALGLAGSSLLKRNSQMPDHRKCFRDPDY